MLTFLVKIKTKSILLKLALFSSWVQHLYYYYQYKFVFNQNQNTKFFLCESFFLVLSCKFEKLEIFYFGDFISQFQFKPSYVLTYRVNVLVPNFNGFVRCKTYFMFSQALYTPDQKSMKTLYHGLVYSHHQHF